MRGLQRAAHAHLQVHEHKIKRLAVRRAAVDHRLQRHVAVVSGAHLQAALQLQEALA